jgi:hypothetical protein
MKLWAVKTDHRDPDSSFGLPNSVLLIVGAETEEEARRIVTDRTPGPAEWKAAQHLICKELVLPETAGIIMRVIAA